jgi:protein-disulfide isomerase
VNEERRKNLLKLASAAVFLAVIAVAVIIVLASSDSGGGDAGNIKDVAAVEKTLQGIPQNGMTLGDPSAKVTLIEFGDLKCPVCKGFSEEIVPPVIESQVRSGEAKIAFRNYTIIDEQSIAAGAAALAAGEQGRGWNYLELFYRNQGSETQPYVTAEFMTAIAKKAGVPDLGRWNKERKSQRLVAEVKLTTAEAEQLGFEGTPSFAIEGPAVKGLQKLGFPESAGELEEMVESAS